MQGFKCVLLGSCGVGKSSIILRSIRNQFYDVIDTTIGAAYNQRIIGSGNRRYRLEIWDTAGQERFDSLMPMYYRDAYIVIIVYDVTEYKSFDKAKVLYRRVSDSAGRNDRLFLMIGNKCDDLNRQVNKDEVLQFCQNNNLTTFECSAKSKFNIDMIFMTIEKHINKNIPPISTHTTIKLNDIENGSEKKRSCVQSYCYTD